MASKNSDESFGRYALWFESLRLEGHALAFPCDAAGLVDYDHLSDRARNDYFYARRTVGREFATPSVMELATGPGRDES